MAFHSSRRITPSIDLNVPISGHFSDNVIVLKSTHLFLRYLFYQRQQIPLPFETLEKELHFRQDCPSRGRKDSLEEMDTKDLPAAEARKKHMEWMRQKKYNIKKKKSVETFIKKGKEFLDRLKDIETEMEHKVSSECGRLKAVRILLGSNISSAKEVYTLSLQSQSPVKDSDSDAEKQIRHAFFSSFLTNEEVTTFVGKSCSLQPIWIMLGLSSDTGNCESSESRIPPLFQRNGELKWKAQPNYRVSPAAQEVNLKLSLRLTSNASSNGFPDERCPSSRGFYRDDDGSLRLSQEDLEEFELRPFDVSSSDPFVRPPSPMQQCHQFEDCADWDANYSAVSMEQTPIRSNNNFNSDVPLTPKVTTLQPSDFVFQTPAVYRYTGSAQSCTKSVPMEETPIVSSKSYRPPSTMRRPIFPTPVNYKSWSVGKTCRKVVPVEETPAASSYRSESRCSESQATNGCCKRLALNTQNLTPLKKVAMSSNTDDEFHPLQQSKSNDHTQENSIMYNSPNNNINNFVFCDQKSHCETKSSDHRRSPYSSPLEKKSSLPGVFVEKKSSLPGVFVDKKSSLPGVFIDKKSSLPGVFIDKFAQPPPQNCTSEENCVWHLLSVPLRGFLETPLDDYEDPTDLGF